MADADSDKKPSDGSLTWLRWVVPFLLVAFLLASEALGDRKATAPGIDYSTFYSLAEQGNVQRVAISGQSVTGSLKAPTQVEGKTVKDFSTTLPQQQDPQLLPLLRAQKVAVHAEENQPSFWGPVLLTMLPWALVIGAWVWIARRARGSIGIGGPLQSILKGRPKRFERQDHVRVHFDDVAGLTNSKRDLQEVVEFLRTPERFQRLGGKLPRGVLLVGPPGTGKTLLARAVAGEAEVPFFYVNGSEFIQLFVGVGASRVRELFDEAKAAQPAIVFIDEIDAVGRSRGAGLGGGNDEREQTLNQLLSEMDGFTPNDHTVVIAATNRPDVLDPALLRPGRFDRRVVVDRPECDARLAILRVHTRQKPLGPDVSLADLARATPGLQRRGPGEPLQRSRAHRRRVEERMRSRSTTSPWRWTRCCSATRGRRSSTRSSASAWRRTRRGTPSWRTSREGAEPLRRVSILPRGMSLGATQQWAVADKHIATEPELAAKLSVLMGGYAAEIDHLRATPRRAPSRTCVRRPISRSAWSRTTG